MARVDDQSPLFQRLGAAVAGMPADFGEFSDEQIAATATSHGVVPLLRERMEAGTAVGLSKRCRQKLDRITQSLVAMELLFEESTRHLTERLREAGHAHLFMKGAVLARLHYNQPWHRPRSDIDVWIRDSEATKVEELLGKSGYRVVNLARNPLTERQFQAERVTFQGVPIWFDLHLKPSNRALFYDVLDFEQCLAEAQLFGDYDAPGLSDRHLLLHTCVHRITHGRNTEKNRLIWLWDVHRLFESQDTAGQQATIDAAIAARLGMVCADALATCHQVFGTEITHEQSVALTANASEPSAALIDSGRWAWMLSDVRHQASWSDRAGFMSEVLVNQLKKVRGPVREGPAPTADQSA